MQPEALTAIEIVTTVIRPALAVLPAAQQGARREQLLCGTSAHESGFQSIAQRGGPALGPFQMEPATHQDLWASYIDLRPGLAQAIMSLLEDGHFPTPSALIPCPRYAAAMASTLYFRCPGTVPDDLAGQAAYWKRFYNTIDGAGTVAEYLADWERLVAPTAHQIWLTPPV
jgi:hypothetical protein